MKTLLLSLIAFTYSLPPLAKAQSHANAQIENISVPFGFDSNDQTEVVLSGYLPTPCHGRVQVKAFKNGNIIELRAKSTSHPDSTLQFCPDVTVPFTETINLGTLSAGQYVVVAQAKNQKQISRTLNISPTRTQTKDYYPYALVHHIERDYTKQKTYIAGFHYSSCLVLDRVEYVSNHRDVISVLPILKRIQNECPRKMTPFKYEIKGPLHEMKVVRFLYHVRSADGKSINSIVNLADEL